MLSFYALIVLVTVVISYGQHRPLYVYLKEDSNRNRLMLML